MPDAVRLAPPVPVQRVPEEHVPQLRHRARPHVRETERGRERSQAPSSDGHHAPNQLLRRVAGFGWGWRKVSPP